MSNSPVNSNIILGQIEHRLAKAMPMALIFLNVVYLDAFHKRYGKKRADQLLNTIGVFLAHTVSSYGNLEDLTHYLGGDSYVIITSPKKCSSLIPQITTTFNELMIFQYKKIDWELDKRGLHGTQTKKAKVPIVKLKATVLLDTQKIKDTFQFMHEESAVHILLNLKGSAHNPGAG